MPCSDVSYRAYMSFGTTSNILQEVRDQVLIGQLDPSACCSYGVCKGDVNVQGG